MGTVSECETTFSLADSLYKAGVSCPELRAWETCQVCALTGLEVCDAELITKLVKLVVLYAGYTDEALQQSAYWQNVSSKLADRFMERDRVALEQE